MFMLLATTAAFAQGIPASSDHEMDADRPVPDFIDIETDAGVHGVVNGSLTSDYSQVGVLAAVYSDGSAQPFCSGSLVTGDIVLTAAHCVEGFSDFSGEAGLEGFVFAIGSDIFDGLSDYRWISGAEIHPDYDPETIAWDLGLVELEESLVSLSPLCLNSEAVGEDWYGTDIDYVGWGMTSMDDPMDGYKRTVTIPIVTHNTTHVFTYADGRNICHGDSGGGAIVEREDGSRMLTGVNSYGWDVETGEYYGCDVEGAGAAAARVDVALDWILPFTGDITCDVAPAVDPETPETPEDKPTTSLGEGSSDDVKVGCSCSSGGSATGGMALALLSLLGLVRRRQS
jgi:MYXO-CTERM domain-containing protein